MYNVHLIKKQVSQMKLELPKKGNYPFDSLKWLPGTSTKYSGNPILRHAYLQRLEKVCKLVA